MSLLSPQDIRTIEHVMTERFRFLLNDDNETLEAIAQAAWQATVDTRIEPSENEKAAWRKAAGMIMAVVRKRVDEKIASNTEPQRWGGPATNTGQVSPPQQNTTRE